MSKFLLAFCCLVLAGCNADRASSVQPVKEESRPAAVAPAPQSPPQVAPTPPAGAEGQAAAAPMLPLDMQVNHPNGTQMRISGIQLGSDYTAVRMAVTNGFRNAIQLNGSRNMLLIDNLGGRYFVAAPPENPQLNVAPGTTLEGTMNFMGRLAPNATSATLVTNERSGSSTSEHTSRPEFRVGFTIKR